MEIMQSIDQAVEIADWPRDEEFATYPEGARDKTLLYCSQSLSGVMKIRQKQAQKYSHFTSFLYSFNCVKNKLSFCLNRQANILFKP